MASATALTLVNRVLSTTGDYTSLSTVVGSPGGIAERIINFLNITIADVGRIMDMPILYNTFSATADGLNGVWASPDVTSANDSTIAVSVDRQYLEEVSLAQMTRHKTVRDITGLPQVFSRRRNAAGGLEVEIYPVPASGSLINIEAYNNPSELTVTDLATTELTGIDDILVLGALSHMDAYDGMNRGYEAKYQASKNKLFTHLNRNKQIRIQPESYR